jgi:hypothetical protein
MNAIHTTTRRRRGPKVYKVGTSVEEILTEWDYLTPAQVFSALAYYHDNQEEIDRVRQRNSYAYWQEHYAHIIA